MFRAAIVEDSDSDRELLESYLEKSGGFIVSKFSSAVDFLTGYQPVYDLVFMDIDMPYLDGMSAAHKLRELDENVCLVFVTNLGRRIRLYRKARILRRLHRQNAAHSKAA